MRNNKNRKKNNLNRALRSNKNLKLNNKIQKKNLKLKQRKAKNSSKRQKQLIRKRSKRKGEKEAGVDHQVLKKESTNDQMKNAKDIVAGEVVHRKKVSVINVEDNLHLLDHHHPVCTLVLQVTELVFHQLN